MGIAVVFEYPPHLPPPPPPNEQKDKQKERAQQPLGGRAGRREEAEQINKLYQQLCDQIKRQQPFPTPPHPYSLLLKTFSVVEQTTTSPTTSTTTPTPSSSSSSAHPPKMTKDFFIFEQDQWTVLRNALPIPITHHALLFTSSPSPPTPSSSPSSQIGGMMRGGTGTSVGAEKGAEGKRIKQGKWTGMSGSEGIEALFTTTNTITRSPTNHNTFFHGRRFIFGDFCISLSTMVLNRSGGVGAGGEGDGGTVKGVVVEVDYLTVVGETGNGSPFWMHYHFLFECIRMVFPQLAEFNLEKEILERMRASDDYAGLSPLQRTAAQYIRIFREAL